LAFGNYDVLKVLNNIQIENKVCFPYLSGPKMANYWLYILTQYTNAKFLNMQEISIIPDTHVQQCSYRLGLTKQSDSPLAVAAAWKHLLSGSKLTPVQMHPVLWNWSQNNFKPEV
jgi:endonuclease III